MTNTNPMKIITIAFDVDGTLISNKPRKNGEPFIVVNEAIRTLLVTLANFKNVKIIVWSGSGELWANQVVNEIGIRKYVGTVMAKRVIGRDENDHPIIEADIRPDIAIDDIQDCMLGAINLIVREK